MEIHSVLPEERARDPSGDTLPWGYRYPESARGIKQAEETGAFGRHRSLRASGSRASRSRAGTTPVRQKENPAVADFSRIFAKEVASSRDEEPATTSNPTAQAVEPQSVATECLLYGYASKSVEYRVLSKYEALVSPNGFICEDYPRVDPNLFLNTHSPLGYNRTSMAVPHTLSKDALKKSRVYKGGQHWIKITFSSFEAAERACFYSPLEIDGCLVYCEMWSGRGPASDIAIPVGSETGGLLQRKTSNQQRGLPTSQSAQSLSAATGRDSAVASFERAMQSQTLPRSHTVPDVQFGQPSQARSQDDISLDSTTASSATATGADSGPRDQALSALPAQSLRSRSVPDLPSQTPHVSDPTSSYMTRIPSVKKVMLRPISEALPKQPSFSERVLRSLPIVSWFYTSQQAPGQSLGGGGSGSVVSEGPILKDDGSWDHARNSVYWWFWWRVDGWLGTDFCGLKED